MAKAYVLGGLCLFNKVVYCIIPKPFKSKPKTRPEELNKDISFQCRQQSRFAWSTSIFIDGDDIESIAYSHSSTSKGKGSSIMKK